MTRQAPPTDTAPSSAGTLVVEEPRLRPVPAWGIAAAISGGAYRLYSLLLRYGNGSGQTARTIYPAVTPTPTSPR